MISHTRRCIFVHITKTGGSSIEELIWPLEKGRTEADLWMGFVSKYHNKYQTGGLQHLFAAQIKEEIGSAVFDAYYKFTMVRNPWDRAISQFSFMKDREDLRDFIGMKKGDDFKKYLSLIQKKAHVQWESQSKFLLDEDRKMMVDFVGRFENFENDVYKILHKIKIRTGILGIKFRKIPHTNKSHRSHYKEYYDSESKEIVEHIYQQDIERFAYEF